MTCIVVEDQPPAQRILRKYIEDLGEELQLQAVYADPIEAMKHLQDEPVDMMFLDVNLPKLSGMELLRTIRQPVKVILTTAYSEYALESYEFDVVDYLLKPFSFARFVRAVGKARAVAGSTSAVAPIPSYPGELFVKSGYEHYKVSTEDILFIHAEADYTELVTKTNKLLSTEPLRHWVSILDPTIFAQVHRSYLINSQYLAKVTANKIYLIDVDDPVPLGRVYKEDFLGRFVR